MLKTIFVAFLIACSASAWSEGIDPDKVIENTIALLVAQKPNDAFEYAIKSNKYFSDMKSDIENSKNDFVSFIKKIGNPTKCEKLVSRNLIQRIRKDVYLCLSPKQSFEINFQFYRQEDAWRTQSFGYSSKSDDYMDESIQIEIGKKSVIEQKN